MRDDGTVWEIYLYTRIITAEKMIKGWFKYIWNRLRTRAWSAHVTRDDLSVVRTSPMIHYNTELDYHNLFYSHSIEYSCAQMSSGGGMAIAWLSLVIVLDYECSNLVYQARVWKTRKQTRYLSLSGTASWPARETESLCQINASNHLTSDGVPSGLSSIGI